MGPVMGLHAHTSRARETWSAAPGCPPLSACRGKRLTPDAPHKGGRSPPEATSRQPRGAQDPPQGTHAKGTVPGPHTRTPASTASGQRTPPTRPKDGQRQEGARLTPDAPHNCARHPSRGRLLATPAVRNAGSQGRTLRGR